MRFAPIVAIALGAVVGAQTASAQGADPAQDALRVCADPNNLPFSNARGEGFENVLAELVAHELGKTVSYTWWAQRRGFIRNTLNAGKCDVIMGVPILDMIDTTRPYYRSTYVFVSLARRRVAEPFLSPTAIFSGIYNRRSCCGDIECAAVRLADA